MSLAPQIAKCLAIDLAEKKISFRVEFQKDTAFFHIKDVFEFKLDASTNEPMYVIEFDGRPNDTIRIADGNVHEFQLRIAL